MNRRVTRSRVLHVLAYAVLWSGVGTAQPVIPYQGSEVGLTQRWLWSMKESSRRAPNEEIWVAYSIQRLMDENSFITTGMYFSGSIDNRTSLYDIILEGKEDTVQFPNSGRRNKGLSMINRGRKMPIKVMKDVGIFVRYSDEKNRRIEGIEICNLDLNFNLQKKKLFWLGPAGDGESVAFLEALFGQLKDSNMKENLVNAVGAHQQSSNAFQFLKKILVSNEESKVRSQAAFWIGNQPRPEALQVLAEVAESDAPKEVKEQTVFAISQIDSDEALDRLIEFARKSRDSQVRRKATFWLGQRVSRKAVHALENMIADDEDTEVQRQALFALSNIPGGGGVEKLISVAKTHPKARIRKQAIMSLGQSDDPRAREALIEIARSN